MKGKAAIVTGGAIRIGREIALSLAEEGYAIALHYHGSKKEATETAKEIEAKGVKCALFNADLSDSKSYQTLIEKTFKTFPQCNLLVNNASIFERGKFLATDETLFDRHMDINFKAPFFLTQHFAKRAKKGQVITMLDTKITKTTGTYFAYLLSKKALAEFTRMAAKSLAPHIRVNGIALGATDISRDLTPQYRKQLLARNPLRALVSLEQITEVIRFLIHSEGITGQWIFLDGGEQLL